MKIEPTSARDVFGSLAFRLLALLTIALMPIGAIAMYQNSVLSEELATRAEDELLNETLNAVTDVRRTFERAFGAVEALGATSLTLSPSGGACARLFERFVGERSQYSFAGILPSSGVMECSSLDRPIDLSTDKRISALFNDAVPFVYAIQTGAASGQPVILIGQPVMDGSELLHFVVVSIPRRQLSTGRERLGNNGALSISTYNASGDVLLTSDKEDAVSFEPEGGQLFEMVRGNGVVFSDQIDEGEERIFSAVPIYGTYVYAIAEWLPSKFANPSKLGVWMFPIVMWICTLCVTYLALNRLVIRHVRTLGRQMRRFARNRTLPELGVEHDQPAELFLMHSNFRAMAEEILQDEAELENAIHEKNGLIREVHHRVKNNLQLIASIMNMQIRKSRNSETGAVVRRLQDRVLGLAAIHRQMYQAQSMSDIPIDQLLDEALSQTVDLDPSGRVAFSRDLIPLHLNSDQAVPLALLASEATLNAVKYVAAKDGETPWIDVRLTHIEGDSYQLVVANSRAGDPAQPEMRAPEPDAGLGKQLIRAFASQLEGRLEVQQDDDQYSVALTFHAKEVDAEFLPTSNSNLSIKPY